MNLQEIEKLLEKYFEGETTLSEENRLREFFSSGNVPVKWKHLESYFIYIMKEDELVIDNPDFDAQIMAAVQEGRLRRLTDLRRPWIYWMTGVAATILILIAVFVRFDPFGKRIEDTYKNPQVAYQEAKKILLFVSSKFNQGTQNLEPVSALDKGLTELKPVTAFNKAVSNVSRLDQVDKVETLITNNLTIKNLQQ